LFVVAPSGVEEVHPLEQEFLKTSFRELLPVLQEKRQQVKNLGLWTPHLPKEYGGMGLPLAEFARLSEEMGRTPLGHFVFNCQAPDIGNMEILLVHGTGEQKQAYLLPLIP
jgi:alkylation response protein AidB-like acyl-CoA dehydrogenase